MAWNENGSTYSSNDNATYWQGYAGYPVIAVLMEQGELPLDRAAAEAFAHVDWTYLNAVSYTHLDVYKRQRSR